MPPEEHQEEYKAGADLDQFMQDKYAMDEKPVDEKPADEKPADEKPADEKPVDDKPADESILPPGFEPGVAADEKKPADVDIKLEDLDEAIKLETNEDKKVNMGHIRTKLEKQGLELSTMTQTLSALREAGIIDDKNNVVAKIAGPEHEQKLNEAYDKIGRLSLVEDPRFQEKYQTPINQKLEQVVSIIGEQAETPEQAQAIVREAASMGPVQRMEYLDKHVPEAMKVVVAAYFKDADDIAIQRNHALQNHHAELERLQQDQTIEEQGRVSEYRNAVKTKVMDEVIGEGFGIFTPKPENPEYTAFLNQIMANVDSTFQSGNPEMQAKAMLLGTAAPVYRGMYEATQTKLDAVTKAYEELKSGLPGFQGGEIKGDDGKPGALPDTNAGLAAAIASSTTKFHQEQV